MNRLKARRKELGLTQKQVAEMLGIKWQVYQQYEYGKKLPNVLLAIKIANTLKTTVEGLYGD
jgi:putative transcriptional regulator